jgi:hypothetical protein
MEHTVGLPPRAGRQIWSEGAPARWRLYEGTRIFRPTKSVRGSRTVEAGLCGLRGPGIAVVARRAVMILSSGNDQHCS